MPNTDEWTKIDIRKDQKANLKKRAKKNKRTMVRELENMLEELGL